MYAFSAYINHFFFENILWEIEKVIKKVNNFFIFL